MRHGERIARATLGYPISLGHPCLYEALLLAIDEADVVRSYLEIGVNEGASLLTVLDASPSIERLYLCDTWGGVEGGSGKGSHAHIERLLSVVGYRGAVTFLDGDSAKTIPTLPRDLAVDLALVDGNHTYEAALTDLTNVYPLVRASGTLLLDDINRDAVARAWNEFRASHPLEFLFRIDDAADATTVTVKRT